PRTLARRVNALYGPGTVSESAPYHWRDRGRVPYPPLPAYVARVLGDALGRYVDPAELWPGRATDTPAPVPAVGDAAAYWSQAGPLLLHQGGHPEHLRRRLFAALGELAMLAAWTAYDSGRHHLSQRYLLTGLRAAHEAGDGPLAARLLGDLSGHAGIAGRPDDAVALGEAAMRAAAGTTAGRAFIAGQLTYAYAVAGDADRVVRTGEQATELLHHL